MSDQNPETNIPRTHQLHLKPSVVMEGTKPQIWFAIGIAYATQAERTHTPLTVTSLCDGVRQPPELHSTGYAADIRTRDLSPADTAVIFNALHHNLYMLGFDVVKETDHIHIEYDPKGNRYLIDRQA